MSDEQRWRVVLCWGAVLIFLTLPLTILVLAIVGEETGWAHFDKYLREYKFIGEFYKSVTALVFGLSGLQSLDRLATKHNEKPKNGS